MKLKIMYVFSFLFLVSFVTYTYALAVSTVTSVSPSSTEFSSYYSSKNISNNASTTAQTNNSAWINDTLNHLQQKQLSLSGKDFGVSEPLSFGINYNSLDNYFFNASYAKQLLDFFAIAGLVEYGSDSYRLGGTLGFKLSSQGLLKLSAEYFSQVLPFLFNSGSIKQRVWQSAYGARYQYNFYNSNLLFQDVSIGSYYANAPNVSLNPVIFVSDGSNCLSAAGVTCANYRNIAGATTKGLDLETDINLSSYTRLNPKLNYDQVNYNTIFTSGSIYDAAGFGGTLGVTQLLTDRLKVSGEVSLRKIYNTYSATISWIPPMLLQLGLEASLTGQHFISHNSTPDDNTVGLQVTFNLDKYNGHLAHYALTNTHTDTNLETYVRVPAVYMDRVLAIADQRTVAVGPAIMGISPNNGSTLGGQVVTITGSNFSTTLLQQLHTSLLAAGQGITVTFCDVPAASLTVVNSTTMTILSPAHAAGICDVSVTTPSGSYTVAGGYTYSVPAPTITSISPTAGPTAGGATVTINGANLTGTSAVTFGGTAATNVTVVSNTQVTAVTPSGTAGSVDVVLTTPGGNVTLANGYTYASVPTITSLSPISGPTAGGATVTINGADLTGTSAVTFGGTAATNVIVVSNTQVTAVTPSGTAGSVDVVLTTPGGSVTLANGYTYASVPTITSLSPTSGSIAGGATVTINGTNFTGTSAVTFGGTAATNVTVVSNTQVTAVIPSGTAGSVDVVLTTPGGSVTLTNGYTYIAPATLTSFQSMTQPIAANPINDVGTNFVSTLGYVAAASPDCTYIFITLNGVQQEFCCGNPSPSVSDTSITGINCRLGGSFTIPAGSSVAICSADGSYSQCTNQVTAT